MLAVGLTEDEADSTIRVSLAPQNTAADADAFCAALAPGAEKASTKAAVRRSAKKRLEPFFVFIWFSSERKHSCGKNLSCMQFMGV